MSKKSSLLIVHHATGEWVRARVRDTNERRRAPALGEEDDREEQAEGSERDIPNACCSELTPLKKSYLPFRGELQDPSLVSQSDSRLHPSSPCCIFIESDKWVLILWEFCLLTCSEKFFTAVLRCEDVHLVYSVNKGGRERSRNPHSPLTTNHKINVGFLCAHTLEEPLNSSWDYF